MQFCSSNLQNSQYSLKEDRLVSKSFHKKEKTSSRLCSRTKFLQHGAMPTSLSSLLQTGSKTSMSDTSSSRNGRPRVFLFTSGSVLSLIQLVSLPRCFRSFPGIRERLRQSINQSSILFRSKSCLMRSLSRQRKVLTLRNCSSKVVRGTTRSIVSASLR